jgi:hypothetical protein
MPGAQGQRQVAATRLPLQYEIIPRIEYVDAHEIFVGSTTQSQVSYPQMNLTHPWVPDEMGYMKFRYQICMSAETHVRLHLLPDYTNSLPPLITESDDLALDTPQFWRRQTLYLPTLTNENAKMKTMAIPCLPYEINI